MGATVVSLFLAFPKEIVYAIAGLALLNTIASSLNTALHRERDREAAIITMLVTASGLSMLGVGSAFWGLIFGLFALKLFSWNTEKEETEVVSSSSH